MLVGEKGYIIKRIYIPDDDRLYTTGQACNYSKNPLQSLKSALHLQVRSVFGKSEQTNLR